MLFLPISTVCINISISREKLIVDQWYIQNTALIKGCIRNADLYDKILVGYLASMGVKKKLSGCQHCPPACCIFPPM